jgi:hypothetical protein
MTNLIATGVPTETQHLRPSTLNTVEKELAWALLLFHRLNSEKDLLFRDNANPKQISYQRFYGQDGNIYLGFTVFMPVDAEFEVLPLKPWEYAKELNDAVASDRYNS